MKTLTNLQKSKIRAFIDIIKDYGKEVTEEMAIKYLDGEDWDLHDALCDYRSFYGIRVSR